MARIPAHTIEDAPAAARPLLAEMIQFSPTGRLLNMHAQMAHAPAVLDAYVSIRRATARHGTLDERARTALMLVAAAADASPYALAIISALALRSAWQPDQVQALLAGGDVGEGQARRTDRRGAGGRRELRPRQRRNLAQRRRPGLGRQAARRGVRLPGPDGLHLLLPQLRRDRTRRPRRPCPSW
jgi:hypothetical protein